MGPGRGALHCWTPPEDRRPQRADSGPARRPRTRPNLPFLARVMSFQEGFGPLAILMRASAFPAWRAVLRPGLFPHPGPVAEPCAHAHQHGCPDRVDGQPPGRRG